MKTEEKVLAGIGLALPIGYGLYSLLKPKEEIELGAGIGIAIEDQNGVAIPGAANLDLEEGRSYTVRVTITNKSTRAGVPWEAKLTRHLLATSGLGLPRHHIEEVTFAAGETKTFDHTMNIPVGSGGISRSIIAAVTTEEKELARATKRVRVIAARVVHAAEVSIGIS